MADKEKKRKKLIDKLSSLKDKLLDEQCHQFDVMQRQGWGYGMRHSKIGFSTTKEDKLRERIKKTEEQIKELDIDEEE